MNKEEYKKLLKTPQWEKKRTRIFKRDKYTCKKCKIPHQQISCHHKYYLEGKLPWEVPDSCLITLCRKCHEKEHKNRKIGTFIRKTVPISRKTSKNKKTSKK